MDCIYPSDIIDGAAKWLDAGRPVAVATIIHIHGSSSRPLGARMVCTDGDEFFGAVSGGCVEGDVCGIAGEVFRNGTARVVHYGRVRDPLLDVGLNCDGEIDVLVETVDRRWIAEAEAVRRGVTLLRCRPTEGEFPVTSGTSVPVTVHREQVEPEAVSGVSVEEDLATRAWERGDTLSIRREGQIIFAQPLLPPPVIVIFGAGPVAEDLAGLAKVVGYTTVISDPRAARFPTDSGAADYTCVSWPDETFSTLRARGVPLFPARTYIVSLEHEPRFEDALWTALLRGMENGTMELSRRPFYIGAIGKAQRAIERDARAREGDVDLSPLRPIHTPIGLDIGGKSSGEIAVSILAQIIAVKNGKQGGSFGTARPYSLPSSLPSTR